MRKKQEVEVIVTRKYAEGTATKDDLLNIFIRLILHELETEEHEKQTKNP